MQTHSADSAREDSLVNQNTVLYNKFIFTVYMHKSCDRCSLILFSAISAYTIHHVPSVVYTKTTLNNVVKLTQLKASLRLDYQTTIDKKPVGEVYSTSFKSPLHSCLQ